MLSLIYHDAQPLLVVVILPMSWECHTISEIGLLFCYTVVCVLCTCLSGIWKVPKGTRGEGTAGRIGTMGRETHWRGSNCIRTRWTHIGCVTGVCTSLDEVTKSGGVIGHIPRTVDIVQWAWSAGGPINTANNQLRTPNVTGRGDERGEQGGRGNDAARGLCWPTTPMPTTITAPWTHLPRGEWRIER
jgi:hypothetical protein